MKYLGAQPFQAFPFLGAQSFQAFPFLGAQSFQAFPFLGAQSFQAAGLMSKTLWKRKIASATARSLEGLRPQELLKDFKLNKE